MSNKADDDFHKRLKQARTVAKIFQKDLAEKVGVTQHQISLYESGKSIPRINTIKKIAEILNISTEWLLTGNGKGITNLGYTNQIIVTQVPLIGWGDVIDFYNTGKLPESYKLIPSATEVSDKSFALKILGDSMASQDSRVGFSEKTIVIFDPSEEIQYADFVLALFKESNEITFKKFIFEHAITYLVPLNPQYKVIECDDNVEIIAKAVQSLNIL